MVPVRFIIHGDEQLDNADCWPGDAISRFDASQRRKAEERRSHVRVGRKMSGLSPIPLIIHHPYRYNITPSGQHYLRLLTQPEQTAFPIGDYWKDTKCVDRYGIIGWIVIISDMKPQRSLQLIGCFQKRSDPWPRKTGRA
jgi:hypothetical protein